MTLQAGPEDRGLRLDIFLARHLVQFTRSHIQALNRTGAVRVANRQEKSGYRLRGDEVVEVDLESARGPGLEPQDIAFQIVYEDDDLVVIEKPAGLVVHPGAGTTGGTLPTPTASKPNGGVGTFSAQLLGVAIGGGLVVLFGLA